MWRMQLMACVSTQHSSLIRCAYRAAADAPDMRRASRHAPKAPERVHLPRSRFVDVRASHRPFRPPGAWGRYNKITQRKETTYQEETNQSTPTSRNTRLSTSKIATANAVSRRTKPKRVPG